MSTCKVYYEPITETLGRKDLEPGKFKHKTVYMASLDVKTAFDVGGVKASFSDWYPTWWPALLAEMQDMKGSACFENCETVFRYAKCIRQGGVEAPVLWERVAVYVLWKAERKMEGQRMGIVIWESI